MLEKPKLLRAIISTGVLAIVICFLWLGLPWMANHFGFALPGKGGFPYRVTTYAGRAYISHRTCAYAGWCQSASPATHPNPMCWKEEDIKQSSAWPLVQVGTISTLFGPPYALMAPQSIVSSKLTPTSIYVVFDTSCYVSYALSGGP
jgi:hypothetical protein